MVRRRVGFSLAEQVVAMGLLGLLLLAVAAMLVQTRRGGVSSRRMFEANCVAQDLLEKQMARAVGDLPLGPRPSSGQLQDKTPYQAAVEGYSVHGVGPYAGLSDAEIKGIRVSVTWNDTTGNHKVQVESILAKFPK